MNRIDEATRTSYDTLAATYVERIYNELDGKPLDRHLLNRFAEELRDRGVVADAGCGPGHIARYLHERGVEMIGIDLSPTMIEHARQLNPGIEFRCADMRAPDLPAGALAGIAAFYSLIHIPEQEMVQTLREFHRTLAPGGLLQTAFHCGNHTMHVDELWGHPVSLDFRFLDPAAMIRDLGEAGFHVIESVEREPYPDAEHPSRRCYLLARALPG
ncbi:MAG TPA: methyltransferase domain-containing protein [Candidatus Kapabacteria bacterium]|nr:methyltransferase domain-containing protein [Candidatus Kapabacteria bacterium]